VGLGTEAAGAGRINANAAVGGHTNFRTESTVVEESLGSGERHCWGWTRKFDRIRKVELELDGPEGADFDLHVLLADRCPAVRDGGWNSDYSSTTPRGDESLVVEDPFRTTDVLNATVASWEGAGDYTLEITEYGR